MTLEDEPLRLEGIQHAIEEERTTRSSTVAVSYTHLTLPTKA